jgi:hypothetical protein
LWNYFKIDVVAINYSDSYIAHGESLQNNNTVRTDKEQQENNHVIRRVAARSRERNFDSTRVTNTVLSVNV